MLVLLALRQVCAVVMLMSESTPIHFIFCAGMLSVAQLESVKAQCPQLQVAHLGAAMTAAEYAAVEHGYKESKQVVLTGIEGLAGGVSDGAVSELCGVFAEMEGLFTTQGALA